SQSAMRQEPGQAAQPGRSDHSVPTSRAMLYPGAMVLVVALLLAAQPAPFDRRERTALLDFHYAWPAEAEAVPALRAGLPRRMAAAYAEAREGARDSHDSSVGAHVPFYREQYDATWTLEAGK